MHVMRSLKKNLEVTYKAIKSCTVARPTQISHCPNCRPKTEHIIGTWKLN